MIVGWGLAEAKRGSVLALMVSGREPRSTPIQHAGCGVPLLKPEFLPSDDVSICVLLSPLRDFGDTLSVSILFDHHEIFNDMSVHFCGYFAEEIARTDSLL